MTRSFPVDTVAVTHHEQDGRTGNECFASRPGSGERSLPADGFLLATDLDGTLLGGSESQRARLFAFLRRNRERVLIVFCTGRGLETILPLFTDPVVPHPDYVVADVGATVVHGDTLAPVCPLQSEIVSSWPGSNRVLERLRGFGGIALQDNPQERRCSFYFEDEASVSDGLKQAVEDLGCDLIVSAGRYLDVMPRGVSKGATLTALLRYLGIDPAHVLVAGDTLNDLSLFRAGFKGIVVGGAERALIRQVAGRPRVYLAREPGAGGILEGICHYGCEGDTADLDLSPPCDERATEAGAGEQELVIVYHRPPFEMVRRKDKLELRRPRSPNGIIPSLLGFFAQGRPGSWIAWSKEASRAPKNFTSRLQIDPGNYPRLNASLVPLTASDIDLFYKRFSKEAFWPIIFSFPSKAVFDQAHWEHFVEINRIFARRTAEEARPGALVWMHDYNLWMAPGYLRLLRPDLRIAFFHHTAFPPPDIFNTLPWHRDIIGSLLQCDYVGFHIPRYVENFADVVRSYAPTKVVERTNCAPRFATYGCALGVDTMATVLESGGRTLRLGAHPVGIDLERIERILALPETQDRIAGIRRELGGRRCLLSVERLDYVKGPLEKLFAYERLLEQHEELHGEITFINIVNPPAPGMEVYRSVREKIDQAAGRVNGRFGRLDWTPIRYFYRAVPFEEVVSYNAVADVAWITPLRDGLNLVAKEYVATRAMTGSDGVLILSEFAGAAVELFGAVLTNPYDATRMSDDLFRALNISPMERARRLRRLMDIVRSNDVHAWGEGFLRATEGGAGGG